MFIFRSRICSHIVRATQIRAKHRRLSVNHCCSLIDINYVWLYMCIICVRNACLYVFISDDLCCSSWTCSFSFIEKTSRKASFSRFHPDSTNSANLTDRKTSAAFTSTMCPSRCAWKRACETRETCNSPPCSRHFSSTETDKGPLTVGESFKLRWSTSH